MDLSVLLVILIKGIEKFYKIWCTTYRNFLLQDDPNLIDEIII